MASGTEAIKLIEENLTERPLRWTFIALGSLKTAAEAMTELLHSLSKVRQIIWSNEDLRGGRD